MFFSLKIVPSIRIEPPKVVSPPLPSEAPHKVASGHVFSTSDTVFDFSEYEANLDKYRLFKTKTFTVTGSKWDKLSQSRQVCLGAQTSIDRLYWLLETAKTWSGPISIALFVPDIEFHISKIYLSFIRRCYPAIREQVKKA